MLQPLSQSAITITHCNYLSLNRLLNAPPRLQLFLHIMQIKLSSSICPLTKSTLDQQKNQFNAIMYTSKTKFVYDLELLKPGVSCCYSVRNFPRIQEFSLGTGRILINDIYALLLNLPTKYNKIF